MKRILFIVVAFLSLTIVGAIAFVDTDFGRDKIRGELQAKVSDLFTGGATIAQVEGTPFGELVLHGVVINGPDGKPAITVGTLRVHMRLLDLVKHDVQVRSLVAEDVDAHIVAGLMKPSAPSTDPSTPSKWTVDMPSLEVKRGHVLIDGVGNLDGVALTASAQIGVAKIASLDMSGTWRERAKAPFTIATSIHDTAELLVVPTLAVTLGGVSVNGSDLQLAMRDGKLPLVGGKLAVLAPAKAVTALDPRIVLPGDVALTVTSTRDASARLVIDGSVGAAHVAGDAIADLDAQRVTGKLVTSEIDLAALTNDQIHAIVGGTFTFDAAKAGISLGVDGHATYENLPRADLTGQIAMQGTHITTTLALTGPAAGKIEAEIERTPAAMVLTRSHIVASVTDPDLATAGRAPVHGKIDVDLTAHGTLTPAPVLGVAGTITGANVRAQDLSIGAAKIVLDVNGPNQPHGVVSVRLANVTKGATAIPIVELDAALRSAKDGTLAIDLTHDRIRTGANLDWVGNSGHVEIGPERITVRDFSATSSQGKLALTGSFGRATGDLTAKVDVDGFSLAALRPDFLGTIAAHADVERRSLRWAGNLDVKGTHLVLGANKPPVELAAKVVARPGTVTVDANASAPTIGGVKLAVDLAAPAHIEDVAAWKARGRDAIRSAQLEVQKIDLGKVAALFDQKAAGQLDGKIAMTPTTVEGGLHVRKLQVPQLRAVRYVDADLELPQPNPGELDPKLTITFADIGKIVASAQLVLPKQLFDVYAWERMGPKIVKSALVQSDKVNLDPAFFDRIGVTSQMRGVASIKLEVAPNVSGATFTGTIDQLRGTPLSQPIELVITSTLDGKAATASIAMSTKGKPVSLVKLDANIPVSIDKLRADPAALKTLPLTGTLEFPKTSVPLLLNVFGRTEVTAGTLDGKIDVRGTIDKPIVKGKIVAQGLEMPPGPRGKPVQKVKQLSLDVAWDPATGGTLAIDGDEDQGGKLNIRAQGDPRQLSAATATIASTNFNFTPLLVFAPGPVGASRGTLDAKLAIKGFTPAAQVTGELHIKNARIPLAPTVGTLRDAQIDVAIHEHDIAVKTTGKLGAGDVKMDGTIALDGASLTGGNAKITLRKVSPIGAVQPVIDADVTAKIARKDATWTADLVVDNGFVKVSTSKSEAIKPVGPPSDLIVGRGKQPTKGKVQTPPISPTIIATITLHNAKVEADEFRTTIRGKLVLTASATAIGMTGNVEALGGDLDLFDRRYRIDQAMVNFDGSLDPMLAVRITHDFTDVTTVTEVRGRLSKPDLELSSDPGTYTKSQLLGFLLGGEPGGDPNSAGARDKVTDAGTSFVASQIGGYIKKALPFDIDVIRYEAASVSSSAAITVGSWVTHTLFFAFSQHLDARPDENSGEAKIEYWFTKRLEVEGTAGDRGYDGVDVLWRKRF